MSPIVSSLFPPKLYLHSRSLSTVSISSSRSPTPVSSIPPTPHLGDTSPSSSLEVKQPLVIELIPKFVDHLDAKDILSLSATTRGCRDLRTSLAFQRHLEVNGWDVEALVRRADIEKDSKRRPWMLLARSALDKNYIATHYASLQKEGEKEKASHNDKNATSRFFRAIADVAAEHDQHNFNTLESLAAIQGLSLIRFVSSVRAHDWKARYRKTFVVAAYFNYQQRHSDDAESDLEYLAQTMDFENTKPPLSFLAARANFLYSYGCISSEIQTGTPSKPVPSTVYDAPHVCTSRGTAIRGVRTVLDRLTKRLAVSGFYQKENGTVTSLHMEFEPRGLASRSKLSFTGKDLITLTATVTDSDAENPWEIDGFFDAKNGVGKFKNPTGEICYVIWITPWGLTGEKIRASGKHLGYFVLHWT